MRALIDRGHDITRTPNEWMALDATDEQQLLGATAQGRCLFTFNVRDFRVFLFDSRQKYVVPILSGQYSFPVPTLEFSKLTPIDSLTTPLIRGPTRGGKINFRNSLTCFGGTQADLIAIAESLK
jgi:hypothetical protein